MLLPALILHHRSLLSAVPCEGKDAVTGSLALLASHYSNSESEEEEQLFVIGDGNCVSQTSAVSKEKSSSSRPPESLRVPDVILGILYTMVLSIFM